MGLENPIHLALLLMVLLLVFGAKRLPEMGRSLGDGLRGFKEAVSGQTPAQTLAAAHQSTAHQTVTTHEPQLDGITVSPAVVSEPLARD